jgi:hypothetical protein
VELSANSRFVHLQPVFKVLLYRFIFCSNEHTAPQLVQHFGQRFIRFFLGVEVSLLSFTILQENLCDPLLAFALLAPKDGT